MRTVKSNLIKMLTIALVVCLGVFVALIPMTKSPVKAEEVSFGITGTSINGAQKGLSFNGSLTGTPDDYGILVYPAGETAIDDTLTLKENEEALDALNFIKQKSAAICFNRDTMLTWESVTVDNVDDILNNFYAKNFTATPYVVVGEETVYGESLTTNMLTVAEENLDAEEPLEKKFAQEVLGCEVNEGVVIEGLLDLETIRDDGYFYIAELYVNGEKFHENYDVDTIETTYDLSTVVNTFNYATNVVNVRVVALSEETDEDDNNLSKIICYNNSEYWTSIISDASELKAALDITYSEDVKFNYGFYKMDADVDLTGVTFSYDGIDVKNQTKENGFAGQFDGCGHTISNIANSALKNGLFGNFTVGGSTMPKVATKIQNLQVYNHNANGTPVFGRFVNNANVYFENLHIVYGFNSIASGLITTPCKGFAKINNVFIADSDYYKNIYSRNNPNLNSRLAENVAFGDVSGKGIAANGNFYTISTVFDSLRWTTPETVDSVTNVITLGNAPVAYQGFGITNPITYTNYFTNVDNGNGTYTHNLKNLGYGGSPMGTEGYVGYAGNETAGNVIKLTGINPAFAELASKSNGSLLDGYYCATCYGTFSQTAGTCTACSAELTYVGYYCSKHPTVYYSEAGTCTRGSCAQTLVKKSLWNLNGAYTYDVTDLKNYVNPANTSTNGEVVFNGVNRYLKLTELKAAFMNDMSIYDSFVGEAGNGMWKISTAGELVWHSEDVEVGVFNEVDFDASTGELVSTALPTYDEIESVTIGSNELTKENGGIIKTEDGYKLNALAKGATETNGIPYMDNNISASNVINLKVTTSKDSVNFSNVRYYTCLISNPAELKASLDIDYTAVDYNFGFYKLDTDVKFDEALLFDYTGASAKIKDINSAVGFVGIFDGAGHTIDFNKTWIASGSTNKYYGLFGNFNHAGGTSVKSPITVKNLALTNIKAGGVPSLSLFAKYSKNHQYGSVIIENIYVDSMGDVPGGLVMEPGYNVKYNNVFIDMRKGNQLDAYYGGIFANALRYGCETMADNVTNFVTLGNPLETSLVRTTIEVPSSKWVKSTLNADGETYTHVIYHGGWSGHNFGGAASDENYFAYAGGNRTHGEFDLVQAFKPMFAEINVKYNRTTAIPGAYCANCGEYFTEDTTVANCPTCVVEEAPVALTIVENLWDVAAAYVMGGTDLSTVDNAQCAAGTNGELVFKGVYQYDSVEEMSNAYTADNTIFASFLGADGNGLWKVVDGVLTWVGAAA